MTKTSVGADHIQKAREILRKYQKWEKGIPREDSVDDGTMTDYEKYEKDVLSLEERYYLQMEINGDLIDLVQNLGREWSLLVKEVCRCWQKEKENEHRTS